jgi:hypothetical protein
VGGWAKQRQKGGTREDLRSLDLGDWELFGGVGGLL